MEIVSATEFQNNFGKYLESVRNGSEVIITKSGKEVARLVSKEATARFLSDSLVGILKEEIKDKDGLKERLTKYDRLN
ncbi:MAG: type II toxin-antitoxin system Phd/YefM family antitoxin [Bacilli bacterium]|jgi:prevent-host-death family protein|nr:type II toxin-antitoxin system Phd/YefM family antitoxin [Bacilli bacterium]